MHCKLGAYEHSTSTFVELRFRIRISASLLCRHFLVRRRMSGVQSLLRPILVGGERRSEFVAIAVYLVVSSVSTVLATLIGSLSEYRYADRFGDASGALTVREDSRTPF